MIKLFKIFLIGFLIFISVPSFAQENNETPTENADNSTDQNVQDNAKDNAKIEERRIFSIGIGLSLGIFYSENINDYISDHSMVNQSEVIFGSTEMYLGFTPTFSLSIMPIKYLNIQAIGEIRWAPKYVSVAGGNSELFNYTRYSPGLMISGYLPLGTGRVGLLLGGGCFYHYMSFEGYSASAIGGRGQFGLRIDFSKVAIDVLGSYDYAPADSKNRAHADPQKINFGNHGVNIGTHVSFKII